MERKRPIWPGGKAFAFTIFDDTDHATVENCAPVYAFLNDLGFRTTKSVWPISGRATPMVGGDTCENREYLRWVLELQKQGFEIGLHNATYHTSLREETIRGLNRFKELFGHEPRSLAQHTICAENIYWGAARTSGAVRLVYNLLTRFRGRHFGGHVETSPLFWGDICRERVSYVRNFVFDEINTLRACPFMPYYDPARPFVRSWYAAAEGPEPEPFTKMLSEDRQDRLEDEGGACIMYTHFGKDFYSSEGLHPRFQDLMKRLSRKNGWFVPVGELLDYLVVLNGVHAITASERNWLERRWLLHKLHTRGTS